MKFFSEETRRRMSESAKRRCSADWRARKSASLIAKVDGAKLEELYASGLTQDEVARVLGVSQKVVYGYMRRNGVAARKAVKRDQRGPENHMWKGDDAGYQALHLRVQAARGTPSLCEHCGTTESARFEWANLTKHYTDVMDYVRLCTSCHSRFDGKVRNLSRKGVAP